MLLSDDKMSHLSHVILDCVKRSPEAKLQGDEAVALRTIKRVLTSEVMEEGEAELAVRARLRSYAKPPMEGSPEWDVLYRKFLDEETRKRKPVR